MVSFRLCILTVFGLLLAAALPVARASEAQQPVALGPDRGWIEALALSPDYGRDGKAWAAAYGGRIFATDDHSSTWHVSHQGETDPVVTGLAVSPAFESDRTLFAAADDGVFRSRDGGASWSNVSSGGLRGHFTRTVVLSPRFAEDRTVYTASDAGAYRSGDGGDSWTGPGNWKVALATLAVAQGPGGRDVLFAGPSTGGLLESADGGESWNPLQGFPSDHTALALAISPAFQSDGEVLVGTDDGVWRSVDAGASWSRVGMAADRVDAVALAPSFGRGGLAFAGSSSGDGVYRSGDGGATWQPAGSLPFAFVQSLAVSPAFDSDGQVMAGTAGGGVIVSADGGTTWREANDGLHAAQVGGLVVEGQRVVMAGNGGASETVAGAPGWRNLPIPTRFVTAYDGRGTQRFVGTQDQGLQESYDGGATWQQATLPAATVSALALAPNFVQDGVALLAAGYVYRSTDGGRSWQQAQGMTGNDVRAFAFSATFDADQTVYAATVAHRLFRSRDGGATWSLASAGLPSDQITAVLLSPRYDLDGAAYAATAGDGIYETVDGGKSWRPLPNQPPWRVVTALAGLPDGALLAGSEKGIFEQNGSGWTQVGGTWDDYVTSLGILTTSAGETLFAGTLGDGVWTVPLPEPHLTPTPTPAVPTVTPPRPTATSVLPSVPPSPPHLRPLHPHLAVLPSPLSGGELAVLTVRGPGLGSVKIQLTAGSWRRIMAGKLARDGRGAFGFVAPTTTMAVLAIFKGKGQTATIRMTVPIEPPRSVSLAARHRPE